MSLNPISTSENIISNYLRYIETTFFINDPDYMMQFIEKIKKDFFYKGPYVEISDSYEIGRSISELVKDNILSKEFHKLLKNNPTLLTRKLYKHQEEAINKIIQNRNTIITTGTGSGKTESFLYPVLNDLLKEKEVNKLFDGIRALIIYPMNALANDQMKRLRELLIDYPEVSFASYTGETEKDDNRAIERYRSINKNEPLPNERISRNQIKNKPPHILITNYAMLEYLMLRPDDNILFSSNSANNWKYIILDEAHTYRGANGIEVSMLIRRLIHLLSNKNNIRFILTSATLGDQSRNSEICSFASRLCADYTFFSDDIVRSVKVDIKRKSDLNNPNKDLYLSICNLIESNSKTEEVYYCIKKIYNTIENGNSINEILYNFIKNEKLYYDLTDLLHTNPLTVSQLSNKLNIDCQYLTYFINIAIKASKSHIKLLDARYHLFVRSLEGAYITIGEHKELFIIPQKKIYRNDEEFRCYGINVCQYCGQIYLEGSIDDSLFSDITDQNKYYLLIKDKQNIEDEDMFSDTPIELQENVYTLCGKCGFIENDNIVRSKKCSCGSKHSVKIKEIDIGMRTTLHHCVTCGSTNTRSSILRSFHLGQEAVASVLLSSLFEELPNKQILKNDYSDNKSDFFKTDNNQKNTIIQNARQVLAFSDSRQESAYFAGYFDFTYNNILRKRLFVHTLRTLGSNTYSLTKFAEHLSDNYTRFGMFKKNDSLIEAWKSIMYELTTRDRNSLESLGLLSFNFIPVSITIDAFSKSDFECLQKILANSFRKLGIVTIPKEVNLSKSDKEFYLYKGYEFKMALAKNGDQNMFVKYWIPTTNNSRVDYLQRAFGFERDKCINFLKEFWKHILIEDDVIIGDHNKYLMDSANFQIESSINNEILWYKCDICGDITNHNINNTCLSYKCLGELKRIDFQTFSSNDHYRSQFCSPKIFPMKIKEHTAQLSPDLAKKYQEEFIKKEINILSCSTTFELGVDVGDLEAVFLKNIPPSPPNYVQRAGRAGRRTDSTAFSLTLCRLSSHDLTFYNNPLKMIKGEISPPTFIIENPKIIKRHFNAIILASFWKRYPDLFDDIKTFFNSNNFKLLRDYITNLPEEIYAYAKLASPQKYHEDILKWQFDLYDDKSKMYDIFANYMSEINDLTNLIKAIYSKGASENGLNKNERKSVEKLETYKKKLENEKIITFLSRKNILPKYGFPIDTVELETSVSNEANSNLRLQRDLSIAISEYAPGSEVIADGFIYVSRYIKLPKGNDKIWAQFDYGICSNNNCNNIRVKPSYEESNCVFGDCEICGEPVMKKNTFITPDYGFYIDKKIEKATTKKPDKTYRSDIYYLGNVNDLKVGMSNTHNLNGYKISIKSTSDDELVIINESNFFVCSVCGYSVLLKNEYNSFIKQSHDNHLGYKCANNKLIRRALGHKYKTDVTSISINRFFDRNKTLSILYALLEGICVSLNIERTDISGCISYYKSSKSFWETSLIIFDTVPGGAGHVRRIGESNEMNLISIFRESLNVVKRCNCGNDGDSNSACYSCICNYQNQKYHSILNRKLAIDFFSDLINE